MSSISDTGIFLLNIVLKLKDGVKNGSELIFFLPHRSCCMLLLKQTSNAVHSKPHDYGRMGV